MLDSLTSLQTRASAEALLAQLDEELRASDEQAERDGSAKAPAWQPLHTVYVPADAYQPDLPHQWGSAALETLERVVKTPAALASLVDADPALGSRIFTSVSRKLASHPIEDLRLDFEDGLSCGPEEEDRLIPQLAPRLLAAQEAGLMPAAWGIRFKSLERATRERGLRTLIGVIDAVADDGQLPPGFRLTLPKVTALEQVSAMARVCDWMERRHQLVPGSIRFEIQVETPQSVVLRDGLVAGGRLIDAAEGRCDGLHFGAYDYTSACGIVAKYQGVLHPASQHAKQLMQVAAATRRVPLSDGATITMPVGTDEEVMRALKHHAEIVRDALARGYYQGWDMHPAQLVTRFAANFAFYLDGFDEAAQRVRRYVDDSAASSDEPASIRALAGHISRAVLCGAVAEADALSATSLTAAELQQIAGL